MYKLSFIKCRYNSTFIVILDLLYKLGYIQTFYVQAEKCNNMLIHFFVIHLRVLHNNFLLDDLKIISTSSLKKSVSYKQLLINTHDIRKTIFVTTNKGLKTAVDCKKYKLGGIMLFSC
jgi:ribosomal protein S8